jgi:hypothetical protein
MFPVPAPGNLAPAPVPVPTQAPAQQHGNPAPQAPNTAPQVNNVVVPDDPRGTKRSRENNPQDSDEPVLKLARTEPAAAPEGPEQKLIKAIRSGDLSGVQMLLRQSPQLLNSYLPGDDGPTPLCLAAQCGQKEIAGFLLSSGSSINAPGKNGSTPLMFASQQGHVEMIRQLCLLGANPNFFNPKCGRDALAVAVDKKQLGACKELIAHGADMYHVLTHPTKSVISTPLLVAIARDFSELLDWWLDAHYRHVDSIETNTSTSLLNLAVSRGALKVVCSLLQRGADPENVIMLGRNNELLMGVWRVAIHFQRWEMVEYLLSTGLRIRLPTSTNSAICLQIGFGIGTDIYIHLASQAQANMPADRVTDAQLRQHPEKAIEYLADAFFLFSRSQFFSLANWWCDQGLLSTPFGSSALTHKLIAGAGLLGQNVYYPERYPSITGATQAQQSQLLVEFFSNTICSPDWPQRFSGLKLTPQGEQTMNQIAVAQGELLLKGIDRLRERFAQQVATLPDICMNTYISLSHHLNEPDLYRKMTKEWGLFDPIARAAIRLVREAYDKLRTLSPQRIPAEFAAMPPTEKLQHVIIDLLEDWDKIPEIVETLLKCDAELLDLTSDLLFQQWRLFGEAFGVTKPRYSQFGPHRLEAEPQMEVDVNDSESLVEEQVEDM